MMDLEINTNKVLIFISGFVFGILVSSFVFVSPLVSLLVIILGLIILGAEKIWNDNISIEVLFISLILISFGLGALRYSVKDFHDVIAPSSLGVIISEPEQKENTIRFVMKADNGEKLLVSTDLYNPVQYGDKVEIKGKLSKPEIINDGVGRPFDYRAYLAKDDIYFIMNFADVEIISRGHGNSIKHFLFNLKHSLIDKMRGILAEPESSLLSGLLLAGKTAIPKDILDEFRRAGVIHIVVLSGYNITIVAEAMRKVFEVVFLRVKLGPQIAAGASIIGIILFVLMTGAEATVVRAALMVLVVIAAKLFGRHYSAPRALFGAAFLMVLHNPKILVFDPSFQLSFLATCGLIYISPFAERLLKKIHMPEGLGLRTVIATTIATQITVLPYLVYSMGEISIVSLLANVLILLLVPVTMFTGFISALLAYISPIVALPSSYVTHLILAWILGVSHFFSNLPSASISIAYFPAWLVVFIYLVLIILIMRLQNFSQPSANSS